MQSQKKMTSRLASQNLTTLGLAAFLMFGLAADASAGEQTREWDFELGVGAGMFGIDGFENNELGAFVTPRYEWRNPDWTWQIAFEWPIIHIPEPRLLPCPCPGPRCPWPCPGPGCPWPCPGPGCPWPPKPCSSDTCPPEYFIEVGPTWIGTPSLSWTRRPELRFSPSLFLGLGFQYDSGKTTFLPNGEQVYTDSTISPVVTCGLALNVRLWSRTVAYAEARYMRNYTADKRLTRTDALTEARYTDDMEMPGPDGLTVTLESPTMDWLAFNLGVRYTF